MNFILSAVLVLGAIGLIAAAVLFLCSKKFAVKEDPRIAQVTGVLPGANCGGCGYPGCGGLADAIVKAADAGSIEGYLCPVGGAEVMGKVADLLGMAVANTEAKVAVVRCNGTCENRPRIIRYSGLRTCTAMHATGAGETGCGHGCLGCGDCVRACQFGAITIDETTGIPVVDEEKCTSCGACVKACPRRIIELRKKGVKSRRIYVRCVNKEKGAIAMKACKAACIGCGKCFKECAFGAITIENNLSYIDASKCRMCRKCVAACPTGAIVALNFPAPKPKVEKPAETKAEKPAEATKVEKPVEATKVEKPAETPKATPANVEPVKKEDKA